MYFSKDIKTNQKIDRKLRVLKLIGHTFRINLGIRHFLLYELYLSLKINTITKFVLFKTEYFIDGDCLFDYCYFSIFIFIYFIT